MLPPFLSKIQSQGYRSICHIINCIHLYHKSIIIIWKTKGSLQNLSENLNSISSVRCSFKTFNFGGIIFMRMFFSFRIQSKINKKIKTLQEISKIYF